MQLHRITVATSSAEARSTGSAIYELLTRNGHRFIWGSAPGQETVGEASTTQKIQLLRQLATEIGAAAPTRLWEIDLRDGQRGLAGARTADRPSGQPR